MEDNEDQPEDVREATPVESEIARAQIDEPSDEPPQDFPRAVDSRVKDIPRKVKKLKKDQCDKKLKKKLRKDTSGQTVTVLIPDKLCTLPRLDVIPRHCLSKKEWLDLLATPSRKCPATCGKKPVERKLRPISSRIDELAKPKTKRLLNTLEARGDILPAEFVDRLVRVLEGETSLTPEQAERLLRDRRKKSSKKPKRKKTICKSDDVTLNSPETHSPLPFDKEAVTCQYLMAETFVKSILQWKSTIPKDEFKDIADIIIKRLGMTLEYTPVDKADRTTQQMRFLADIIAAWIAGVLFEVAENHREELEKECEERKKMLEEQEEETESSESELEEFVPVKKPKTKILEKPAKEQEQRPDQLADETDDKSEKQQGEQEKEKPDEKPDDSPRKDDEGDGTGAGGTSDAQQPPDDAQGPAEQPEEPPADEEQPGGEDEEPQPTEAAEPSGPLSELPADEGSQQAPTTVPSETPSKVEESEIATVPEIDSEMAAESVARGDEEIAPASASHTPSPAVPATHGEPDGVSIRTDVLPEGTSALQIEEAPGEPELPREQALPGETESMAMRSDVLSESATIPPTRGESHGMSIRTDTTVPGDGVQAVESEVAGEHTEFQDRSHEEEVYLTPPKTLDNMAKFTDKSDVPAVIETKTQVKTGETEPMADGTHPIIDETRPKKIIPTVPKGDFLEGNLKQMLQTDVPFLDLLRILERIENAIAKERENLGDDLTTDRIHRAIYEKLQRLARAENPEGFSSHLQDVLDVLSGKVAHWVKDALTSSELQFLEEHPPLISSEELKTFGEWISEVSERTATWTIWMQNMIDQLLKMQAAPITRIDWQNWTRKFASDALLWRRYFLESSHHAHHNRTMLAGRGVVKSEDFKHPEWRESKINTVDLVKE